MEKSAKRPSVLMIVCAVLICAFCAVLPMFWAIAPGILCFVLYTGGARRFLLVCAACSVCAAILFSTGALFSQACIIVAASLIYFMVRKRVSYFDTALFTSGAITLTLYLMICLEDLISGAPAFYAIQSVFSRTWEQTLDMMRSSQGAFTDAQLSAYEKAGRDIALMLPTYMPAAICALGAFFGLFNVAIMLRLCNKADADIRPASPFHMWRIPQSFVTGAIIMSLGSLILPHIGVTSEAVMPAVTSVVMIPFAVQGFCLTRFVLRMRKYPSLLFALFVILTILTFPTSAVALAVMGLIEQMFAIRGRMHGDTTH